MSNTNFQPPPEHNFRKMSRAEILRLFAWYDFKDTLGHELINCRDFVELIEAAISSQSENKIRETEQVSL